MKVINFYVVNVTNYLHGVSKQSPRRIFISTWAMLMRQDHQFFNQFDCFIIDEAHQVDSSALSKIINNLNHVKYRFGFTRHTRWE